MEFAFDLKDIFGTFAVGFYVSITLIFICYTLATYSKILIGKHEKCVPFLKASRIYLLKRSAFLRMLALLLLVLVYAIGDITEMLTEHYSDTRSVYGKSYVAKKWIEIYNLKEEDIRMRTLFEIIDSSDSNLKIISKTYLGHEVFLNKFILSHVIAKHQDEQQYNTRLIDYISCSNFSDSLYVSSNEYEKLREDCSTIYYISKNWAYNNVNYFDELQTIQLRVDFCRSVSLLGFSIGIISVFIFLV